MSESRVRENRMHGSMGGRWRNGTNLRGAAGPRSAAGTRRHDDLVGTSTAAAIRQTSGLPHRCGVGLRGPGYPRKKPPDLGEWRLRSDHSVQVKEALAVASVSHTI